MKTKLKIILVHALGLADGDKKPRLSNDDVEEIFTVLDKREREILKYRFKHEPSRHTLNETGEDFSVTRERIRQLQNRALKKLREATKGLIAARTRALSGTNLVDAQPIFSLHLSTATHELLVEGKTKTIGKLRSKSREDMLLLRQFGVRRLKECHDALMREYQIDAGWFPPAK